MKQEQDHKLEAWLAHYLVADADEALLDKIVAVASAMPQMEMPLFLRLRHYAGLTNAVGWVAVALFGFWIGNSSLVMPEAVSLSAQQISAADIVYMNQLIFGPKTWKEVSL